MQVGSVHNQFSNHVVQVSFRPRSASAVKVKVAQINYGGYLGGAVPSFWSATVPGTACIHSIGVYAGDDAPSKLALVNKPELPLP
jgi:hypothetical protein